MTSSRSYGSITARFDKNALVLFSRKDGAKIRIAIGEYSKASKPELVDIKVSDYCSFGCDFCYQGSTKFGKHSTPENIDFIVSELAKARVFEVAIGGGEPLETPHIVDTFKKFHAAGIVPNFTTKFPGLVRKFWPEIGHIIGGFAYSAETPAQIRSSAKLFANGDIPKEKVNLHYVMGLGNREHFREYLRAANEVGFRVTLLGYKTTGRGKEVIPHPYDWWVQEVTDLIEAGECPDLSIDTPLADQYHGKMPVAKHMTHRREGAFSMYIDAVALTMGASSFDEREALVPFDSSWLKRYKTL